MKKSKSSRYSVKPGDLVSVFPNGPDFGIIVHKSDKTNTMGRRTFAWWWILLSDGVLIEEIEDYLYEIKV